jgi:hypothetical protein
VPIPNSPTSDEYKLIKHYENNIETQIKTTKKQANQSNSCF